MQRSLIIAAALTSVSAGAFAQSSVTLYGRLNLSVESQEIGNAGNTTVLQNSASRWGIKGIEDLGGGIRAGFQLESGFDPANGSAGPTLNNPTNAFWGRQSEVFLSSNWGMVRLGNFTSEAYYATADYVSLHNHDTGTSADVFYTYLGRDTSKVSYRAPSFGGATFEIGTSISSPTEEDTLDLALNYDAGQLHLGAGYQMQGDAYQFAVRGLYEMGALTFGGYYQRSDLPVLGSRDNFRLAAMYTIGNTELHANWGTTGGYSNAVNDSSDQFTVAVNQNLSKRTKVYAFYTMFTADVPNADFSSFAVGIRHNF
jgi:predicted porin